MEYYHSEITCLNGQCKHWISLKGITSVAEGKSSRTHSNTFEIVVNKSKYVFSVDSLTERAEWIAMIKDITLPKQMKDIPDSLKGNEHENGGLVRICSAQNILNCVILTHEDFVHRSCSRLLLVTLRCFTL